MNKSDLLSLPQKIKVSVVKSNSGVLLAELPEYDVFTEADNLNHLYFQVNDLICTYFDIPKELQDEIRFVPPLSEQKRLINLSDNSSDIDEKINVSASYSSDVFHQSISR